MSPSEHVKKRIEALRDELDQSLSDAQDAVARSKRYAAEGGSPLSALADLRIATLNAEKLCAQLRQLSDVEAILDWWAKR